MEFNHIVPHDGDMEDADGNEEHPTSRDPPIWAEVRSYLNIASTSHFISFICDIIFFIALCFCQAAYLTSKFYM